MTNAQMPPQIFDRALLRVKRARAARRQAVPFLMERCIEDGVEKLLDINRQFDRALFLAPAAVGRAFNNAIPAHKRPQNVTYGYYSDDIAGLDCVIDEEALAIESAQFDLIVSFLTLHTVNDMPGALVQLRRGLKPDGALIASVFGGDTLAGLRQAAYSVDADLMGGISPRVFPLPDFQQLAGLLQRAGFALPVVDTDRVKVTYSEFDRLIADLRDMGETNSLLQRDRRQLPKSYKAALADVLQRRTGEKNIQVEYEILWLTGWSPHESQQKPLKPGSAQVSLIEVLKDKSSGGT